MNETKRNRLAAAVTLNIILLIVILAAVVIYQLIYISVITRRRDDIAAQIEQLREDTEHAQDTLDYYKSEEYLYLKALEFHYVYGD